jgi:hypothetical protein
MKEPRTTKVRMEKSFIEAFRETATTRDRRRGDVLYATQHPRNMARKWG